MALSSELVSQFAKVTIDGKETKKETTVYGTIVEYNGVKHVRLDGSELLTPISTTVNVKPGERVTVLIKNHTATVTGNISSPSVGTGDIGDIEDAAKKITEFEIALGKKVDTEELNAEIARIDALQAENVTIKQTLSAAEGDIDNLQTQTLTIKEDLTASNAKIDNLKSTKLDVEVATATYATVVELEATNTSVYNLSSTYAEFASATIDSLQANEAAISELDTKKLDAAIAAITYATIANLNTEKARIDDLEAEIGDIDTLIFGSATGSVIQSSFANAVIAQLGDAQIKSAMIENIAADKITSGDIVTNNVRVISEDGKLLISDETIQISDDNRVRVQIGKDSSDDYSINIWDEEGNLMFSKGGITDSAIKEAIIRNDMVSDDANIAAHKLDINSLFEEINGSTKTIKSSRIYLDDKSQTLDVAFESMSSNIEELQNGVSSQGTQITAMQGQIASKIWQTDINAAVSGINETTENLSTQYEELVQDVDGMSATVASHTSTLRDKADSSTVTEVNNKVTNLESDLSGFKTTVSDTYATKTEVSGLSDKVSTAETNISQNSTEIALRATKTEVSEAISEVQIAADEAQNTATSAEERAASAESLLQILSESIAMLVTDANGQSLMTQTDNGWTFSTGQIQSIVDTTSENLDNLINEVGDIDSTVGILQQALDDLGMLTDYVKISTYEDEPCIELGETDSEFKLLITNTRIMFMEGNSVPAYITNQALHIRKAVIEEELQQGEFIWKARGNGNLGLMWKGVIN